MAVRAKRLGAGATRRPTAAASRAKRSSLLSMTPTDGARTLTRPAGFRKSKARLVDSDFLETRATYLCAEDHERRVGIRASAGHEGHNQSDRLGRIVRRICRGGPGQDSQRTAASRAWRRVGELSATLPPRSSRR